MLQLKQVWFRYSRSDWVLQNCNLTLAVGERVLLRGANGCGKSTLLRLMAGQNRPEQGHCRWSDGLSRGAALLPQETDIDWQLPISCYEIVATGWRAKTPWWKPRGRGRKGDIDAALNSVGLLAIASKPPSSLSGGQRQRLLIARMLVQGSRVMLLDEPLSGLDAKSRQELSMVLERISRDGKTAVVIASHEVSDFPLAFDRDLHFIRGALQPTIEAHCEVVEGMH
jgi:zinc/manganese transport system ATP-binding protein